MKRLRFPLVAATALVCSPFAAAQEVAGDRPGFSNGPLVLDPGFAQLEFGYTYTDSGTTETHALGQALVRYGLPRSLELRFGFDGLQWADGPGADPSGPADAAVGLKWTWTTEAEGSVADVGLLVGTSVPTGDSEIGADSWQPGAALAISKSVSDRAGWTGYVAYVRAEGAIDRFDQISGSVSLSVAATEEIGLFVELYGFDRESENGSTALYLDGGITRALSERWVVDLSAGVGVRGAGSDWFVGFGAVTGW